MKNEWAVDIKGAITRYREQIIPWIDEGPECYEAAGMELNNSIYGMRFGIEKMPVDGLKARSIALLSRFCLLQEKCRDETPDKEKHYSIDRIRSLINEKIKDVEPHIDKVLKSDAGQNDEQYQQGL